MTLAEIARAIESKKRILDVEEKRQAIFVYTLADLIGHSVARIHNKNNTMPTIGEVFPSLFNTKEEQERQQALKLERFKAQLLQFTNSHNEKLKGG